MSPVMNCKISSFITWRKHLVSCKYFEIPGNNEQGVEECDATDVQL